MRATGKNLSLHEMYILVEGRQKINKIYEMVLWRKNKQGAASWVRGIAILKNDQGKPL